MATVRKELDDKRRHVVALALSVEKNGFDDISDMLNKGDAKADWVTALKQSSERVKVTQTAYNAQEEADELVATLEPTLPAFCEQMSVTVPDKTGSGYNVLIPLKYLQLLYSLVEVAKKTT
ncbi:Hypothetical protein POVN_LOCUS35 [uncultured virus]|nr:Hypothetical protein POVN_LOCUS35 [uncultured virus]